MPLHPRSAGDEYRRCPCLEEALTACRRPWLLHIIQGVCRDDGQLLERHFHCCMQLYLDCPLSVSYGRGSEPAPTYAFLTPDLWGGLACPTYHTMSTGRTYNSPLEKGYWVCCTVVYLLLCIYYVGSFPTLIATRRCTTCARLALSSASSLVWV